MSTNKVYLLPKVDQQKIKAMVLEEHMYPKQIGRLYNLSGDVINTFLKKEGIHASKVISDFWEAKARAAIEDYTSGMLLKDVVAKHELNSTTVENYMRKFGITYKNDHGRKNFFNQAFFHDINNEAAAYFLGFLFADGNISGVDKDYTRPCNITLTLSMKDRVVLENFLAAIEGSGNTHIRDFRDSAKSYAANMMSTLSLTSTKMADDLIALGFSGLKSTRNRIPDIEPCMLRHFIRGYFEGDGCATTQTIQFTGYVPFLQNLMITLNNELSLPMKKIREYSEIKAYVGDLQYHSKDQQKKLYHYMYDNAKYTLPRKEAQILKILM